MNLLNTPKLLAPSPHLTLQLKMCVFWILGSWQNIQISTVILWDVPSGYILVTLRKSNAAMEKGPFMGDLPIKTSIHGGFSVAMFDYQRVRQNNYGTWPSRKFVSFPINSTMIFHSFVNVYQRIIPIKSHLTNTNSHRTW